MAATGTGQLAATDIVGLEFAQTFGQHVSRGAANGAGEIEEAQRPQQELAHDQQRPALTDPVQGEGEAARLARIPGAASGILTGLCFSKHLL